METIQNLQNHFLIAMPHLSDPNFFHSVTFICEHSEKGAIGFTINRPLGIMVDDILDQMSIDSDNPTFATQPVFAGGPVQIEQGFVLHRTLGNWQSSLTLDKRLYVTTSRDILAAIAQNKGPKENLILLGYSGWGAGQLEEEIQNNLWLVSPADDNIIFDLPHEKRWQAAAQLLGVDITKLSDHSGHA